jgi:AcrR family transcriptional regulator
VVTLRERKRARTRTDLISAALTLFERNGFERTTIAEIAASAEIGSRTFFSYFETKEQVLFPDAEARVAAAVAVLDGPGCDGDLVDSLLLALRAAVAHDGGVPSGLDRLRAHLIRTVPSVHREALLVQFAAERRISCRLAEVSSGRLSPVAARALTAATISAVVSAVQMSLEADTPADPICIEQAFRVAREALLAAWPRA